MRRKVLYLLIAIFSGTLSANENTYYQHESNVAFHVAVESLSDAVLAIEGQNGLIFNSRWIFGEIGTPIADICEGQQSPDLNLGVILFQPRLLNLISTFHKTVRLLCILDLT